MGSHMHWSTREGKGFSQGSMPPPFYPILILNFWSWPPIGVSFNMLEWWNQHIMRLKVYWKLDLSPSWSQLVPFVCVCVCVCVCSFLSELWTLYLKDLCSLPLKGFPCSSVSKESGWNAEDWSLIPGSGRSPGEGSGNPLQYSCLENPMHRGAWQATVQGVAELDMTQRLNHHHR